MRTTDIIDTITSKGLNVRYSWSKDYSNGTSLFEYKIYKSSRHRKPLAYVQIGYCNTTKNVIGFTFSVPNKPSECIDCENLSDLENALAQIFQYNLTENANNLEMEKTISNIKDLQKLAMSMTKDEFLSFIIDENIKNKYDVRENDNTIDFEYLNLTATINKTNNKLSGAFDVWDNEGNWIDTFYYEETPFKS